MKKAIIFIFILLLGLTVFTACAGDGIEICFHEWENVVKEDYLKSEATCSSPAIYYSSCKLCGKTGDTFEYGSATDHSYAKIKSDKYLVSEATCNKCAVYTESCRVCGKAGENTFELMGFADHSYQNIANEDTLAEEATCLHPNTFYYSCKHCGVIDEVNTFTLGPKLPHTDSHGDMICDKCESPLEVYDDVPVDNMTGVHEFGKN